MFHIIFCVLFFSLVQTLPRLIHASSSSSSSSSGSNRRYASYDYDLTTPQFTPDGRLLQVEYATESTRRSGSSNSNPIVSVALGIPGKWNCYSNSNSNSGIHDEGIDNDEDINDFEDEEGDTILIMATISSLPPTAAASNQNGINDALIVNTETTEGERTVQHNNIVLSRDANPHQRTQFRIIEVPISASYQHYHHHHHHHGRRQSLASTTTKTKTTTTTTSKASTTILVGMSGILSDATSLLKLIYSTLEDEQRTFGWHPLHFIPVGNVAVGNVAAAAAAAAAIKPPTAATTATTKTTASTPSTSTTQSTTETTLRLSRTIADQCQKHAFGGGLRPLGATLLLAGLDSGHSYHHGATKQKQQQQRQQQQRGKEGARVAMCETDPSGSWRSKVTTLQSRWMSANRNSKDNGKHDDDVQQQQQQQRETITESSSSFSITPPQIMVSGGSLQSQSKLQSIMEMGFRKMYQQSFLNHLNNGMASNESNDGAEHIVKEEEDEYEKSKDKGDVDQERDFLRKALQTVISSLMEEWRGRGNTSNPFSSLESKQQQHHQALPPMELVFVSSRRGTFRLSAKDIAALMNVKHQ